MLRRCGVSSTSLNEDSDSDCVRGFGFRGFVCGVINVNPSTRAKFQDTRASPNSLETHLVRKWEGHWTPTGCWSHLKIWKQR